MLKPKHVPKEVIVELLAALNSCDCDDCTSVAIAAALNAWPGAFLYPMNKTRLILPLPQEENPDA